MKKFDAVHGFIHFSELEAALIDSPIFQRLHYLHQLGIAYLVYPGATHSRFEHSLGTMHLASAIFDRIASKEEREYWRQMVRLAALCHDLGHLPFSHVAEKRLLGKEGHELWTYRILLEEPVIKQIEDAYPDKPVKEHLVKLAIGEEKLKLIDPKVVFTPWERVYAQIITGDFFGADRIDYLLRDAKSTGVSHGLFDYNQLIETLRVVTDEAGRLTLGIEENGLESCEALLLARHFMQRRVYQYTSVQAYAFHLARFMEGMYKGTDAFSSVEKYVDMGEAEVLCELKRAFKDSSHPGHGDAVSIFDRKKRFQAIALSKEVKEVELERFKKEKAIPQELMEWEMQKQYRVKSWPILLRKNQQTVSAEKFSEIFPPLEKNSWLYLSPEYAY